MPPLPFARRLSFDQRRSEFERVSARQPGHVPAIVQPASSDCPRADREKFLLPRSLTGAQLAFVLRKHLRMESTQALFVTCGGCLVPAQESVETTYERHKDEDGFLYVTYALENAFGSVSRRTVPDEEELRSRAFSSWRGTLLSTITKAWGGIPGGRTTFWTRISDERGDSEAVWWKTRSSSSPMETAVLQ